MIGTKGDHGHFVTLQSKGHDGKPGPRHVVFIREHHVEDGHPRLKGKRSKPSHQLPDEWRNEARAAKINPAHLQQLAHELKTHHDEYVNSVNTMLKRVRTLAKRDPQTFGSLSHFAHAFRGGGATAIKGFDALASQMASEYPELFPGLTSHDIYGAAEDQSTERTGSRGTYGHGGAVERLYDLLLGGNQHPMTKEESYEQALRHLGMEQFSRQRELAEVPFSAGVVSHPLGGFVPAGGGLSAEERAAAAAAGLELCRWAGLSH